jgi:hypothetical protein
MLYGLYLIYVINTIVSLFRDMALDGSCIFLYFKFLCERQGYYFMPSFSSLRVQ